MPRDATQLDPSGVYANRFAGKSEFRDALWSVLCTDFFQKYIPEDSHVLELAAGHCEFINHIRAAVKTAVDINPDTARHAAPGVKVVLSSTTDLSAIPDGSQDVVFASNFFEHLPKPDIVRTLRECHRILRCSAGGGATYAIRKTPRFATQYPLLRRRLLDVFRSHHALGGTLLAGSA